MEVRASRTTGDDGWLVSLIDDNGLTVATKTVSKPSVWLASFTPEDEEEALLIFAHAGASNYDDSLVALHQFDELFIENFHRDYAYIILADGEEVDRFGLCDSGQVVRQGEPVSRFEFKARMLILVEEHGLDVLSFEAVLKGDRNVH